MIVTPFDGDDDLIVVWADVWGEHGFRRVPMAVDTGSSETIIIPEVTDALGYGAHLADRITVIRSVVGELHVRPASIEPQG